MKKRNVTIEDLLKDIDNLNGSENVRKLLKDYVENNLITTSGMIIIWTHGNHVSIDGTQFSEAEAVWALSKALFEVQNKGISFT